MKAYLNEQGVTGGYINLGGNVLALVPNQMVPPTKSESKNPLQSPENPSLR